MTGSGAPRRGLPALLEALRAPLLLSPAADVAAGWALVAAGTSVIWHPRVLLTALGACMLLAAGMAQNALTDHEDDRRHKPGRPLPRGAVSETALQRAWGVLTLAGLALLSPAPATLSLGLAIVLGSWVYHFALKERRVPGCVLLGLLRGGSMGLGVAAAASTAGAADGDTGLGLLGCALYAVYLTGASLHASTDDQPPDTEDSRRWSGFGLSLSTGVLGLWLLFAGIRTSAGDLSAGAALVVLVWALARLGAARARLPAPVVTGVALSGLHLLHAGVCLLVGSFASGGAILALYGVSRGLLRIYPPS